MADSMYREEALEELASPDELDKLMQITGPKGWFALAGLAVVVITTVLWGIYGSIPTDVTAIGVYVKSGGVQDITTPATGQIAEITVRSGDRVEQGDVVAYLNQPELRDKIKNIRQQLELQKKTRAMIKQFQTKSLADQMKYIKEQRQQLTRQINNLREQLKNNREILQSRRELYEDGLINRQQLLAKKQQIDQLEDRIGQAKSDSTNLNVKKVQLKNEMKQKLNAQDVKINQTRQKLDTLLNQFEETRRITAPQAGRVLELKFSAGDLIQQGQSLLTVKFIGRTIQDLELVAYVSPGQGKKVQQGMDVKISPETVEQEKFGFMLGKVKSVSEFPVSRQAILQVVDNERLVQQFSKRAAPIQVFVSLVPDAQNVGDYRWSSAGPPTRVTPGTMARVKITVDRQPPINLVIPKIREFLGV